MKIANWNIESLTGYQPLTTIYMDLSIADRFGMSAVKETITRVLTQEGWIHQYKELTELVLALNWKVWEHYKTDEPLARMYQQEYERVSDIAMNTLEGKELEYYYNTID